MGTPIPWTEGAVKTVLILGDVMLDRFVYGRAIRISPEAPIPILHVERETAMLGGAGNVARNVAALGGRAILIGVRGDDEAGWILQRLVDDLEHIEVALTVSPTRLTTEKIRYIADRQQIMRSDREETSPALAEVSWLIETFRRYLTHCDAVALSDYAKGVLCDPVLQGCLNLARRAGKPTIVDPKSRDLKRYNGATIVTPNLQEAMIASALSGEDDDAVAKAADSILRTLPDTKAVLISRGSWGMSLAERDAPIRNIPAIAKEVFDVAGAGDTVVAALALGVASGATMPVAAEIANQAAGIAVSKIGTAAVTKDDLISAFHTMSFDLLGSKLHSIPQIRAKVNEWRRSGAIIGFTNGCFDLIHGGHVSLLNRARAQCTRLIVGINSDASVRRLKGEMRPVQNETMRQMVIASLAAVDAVVVFEQNTPEDLIRLVCPDLLIKGDDYRVDDVAGGAFVQGRGGKVILIPTVPGQSTTEIIARIARRIA